MARRAAWVLVCAVLLGGCGSGASTTTPFRPLLGGDPALLLLQVDDLAVPGFTVAEAAHTVGATDLAGSDSALERALRDAGLRSAASVSYLRPEQLATANGPLDVISTTELFGDAPAAAQAYAATVRHAEAVAGSHAVSTGPLGDEAHADTLTATAADQTQVIQVTVIFRVNNAIDVLVSRGRLGGTGVGDALILAHHQAKHQGVG